MTSAPINDAAKVMSQNGYGAKGARQKNQVTQEAMEGFAVMMAQATDLKVDIKTDPKEDALTCQSTSKSDYDKYAEASNLDEEPESVQDLSDYSSEITQKEDEIKSEIAKELGITIEELEGLMEELGITLVDLTDKTNVIALMGAKMPGIDAVSIMTDESAFRDVVSVVQIVQDGVEQLARELGVEPDELTSYMEQIKEAEPVMEQVVVEAVNVDSEETVSDGGYETEIIQTDQVDRQENVTETVDEIVPKVVNSQDSQRTDDNHQSHEEAFANQTQQQNVVTGQTDNIQTVQDNFFAETSRTQEILDQIAEYVKINARPEITEMEIQLNPANLGTVNLQVAAKDGVVTAQITTQNEAVRQALETQALILKDTLEQQGVKVEAVEVTVASHEFEQNLEQGNEQNAAEQNYEEQIKRGTRRINLDNMSSEEIEQMASGMSEAEMIQIDMMNRSGNKIDFLA